jgi:hypothetical protein
VEKIKSRSLKDSWKQPPKDSKLVTNWQAKVKKSRKDVQTLDTKNKALTSGSKNPPLPMADLKSAASSGSKTASQMAVEAASFKVTTAREMYKTSLASADTARSQLLQFQTQISKTQMGNIKSDLEGLIDDKITLVSLLPFYSLRFRYFFFHLIPFSIFRC